MYAHDLNITFSTSKELAKDYISNSLPFGDFGTILKSEINYSPFQYRENYRKEDNSVLTNANCIFLDFDDGLSIDKAKGIFSHLCYVLATTKSHQKEKNGKVCDRFRIVIPCETNITLSKEEYKELMNDIITTYGADRACKKIKYENNTKDTMPIFSTSSHLSNNYINNKSIKWEDLYKVVCSSDNIMYSAHTYLNNHRNKKNAISGFNLLMLDFDEDATIKEVSEYFKDYSFLIATTKSHLKMKNNKISERFRLILKLNKTIYLNQNEYELFMKKIIKSLPFKADNACVDISRMFFSSI